MIEAELKARVVDPAAVRSQLDRRANAEVSLYRDTYYDTPGHHPTADGRELRIRIIEAAGITKTVVTYKEPAVESESGSKPEHETSVADPETIDVILRALGLEPMIAFEKQCTNYRFSARGRDMLATMVTVQELDGTFLELETLIDGPEVPGALEDLRDVLHDLGVRDHDLTTEQYTDAVSSARKEGQTPSETRHGTVR